MGRFVRYWLILGIAYAVARPLAAYLLLHQVDLRFASFAELLLVPGSQALVVAWLLPGAAAPKAGTSGWRELAGRPTTRLVALIWLGLVAASVVWAGDWFRLGGVRGWVPTAARATGLGFAALLFAALSRRGGEAVGRRQLAGMALVAGAWALEPWTRVLPRLVAMLPDGMPLVFRALAVYGLAVTFALSLLVRGATLLRGEALGLRPPGRDLAAALSFDAAVALALAGLTTAVLGYFRLPYLVPPWDAVVASLADGVAGCVLLAALALWSPVDAS
jgi:hypothetical protein